MKLTRRKRWNDCETPKVAFTPKGGCPLKRGCRSSDSKSRRTNVAFTPKGGCPLKHNGDDVDEEPAVEESSIHPQGWVPVET